MADNLVILLVHGLLLYVTYKLIVLEHRERKGKGKK